MQKGEIEIVMSQASEYQSTGLKLTRITHGQVYSANSNGILAGSKS